MEYVGIDIGSEKVDIAVLSDKSQSAITFDNTKQGYQKLDRYLKKHQLQDAHLCMEATGRYGEQLCDFLYAKSYKTSVVNPVRIKAYAQSKLQRNKTDRLDASLIADFCASQTPSLWQPPAPHWQVLQMLIRHLETLEDDLQRQKNRVHALERTVTPAMIVLKQLNNQVAFIEKQIIEVKQALEEHINNHSDIKEKHDLLISIPGIGKLTAAKLLGEFGDMSQFENVREVVAFAGLNPRHHQFGKSIQGKTRISKMGRSSIRAALYMPAISAKNYNPPLQIFAQRLESRGKSGREIVVAIMRKLLHQVFGILKSRRPFDPNHLSKIAVHT